MLNTNYLEMCCLISKGFATFLVSLVVDFQTDCIMTRYILCMISSLLDRLRLAHLLLLLLYKVRSINTLKECMLCCIRVE